jgi:hypothetical protein
MKRCRPQYRLTEPSFAGLVLSDDLNLDKDNKDADDEDDAVVSTTLSS